VKHFPGEGTLYESAGSGHLYFFVTFFFTGFSRTLNRRGGSRRGGFHAGAGADLGNQDLLRRIYL
jgi:hypothetical protein